MKKGSAMQLLEIGSARGPNPLPGPAEGSAEWLCRVRAKCKAVHLPGAWFSSRLSEGVSKHTHWSSVVWELPNIGFIVSLQTLALVPPASFSCLWPHYWGSVFSPPWRFLTTCPPVR